MKNRNFSCLIVLLSFLFTTSVYAQSSVWKIEKGENRLFIGGTIHVLSQSDYPLPPEFGEAYRHSDRLILETDLGKLTSPEFQKEILGRVLFTDGRNLQTVLSKATFQKLQQYLDERGIPIANLMNLKPGMVAITLTNLEMQRLGLDTEGVDQFFYSQALRDGMETGELESVNEQLDFMTRIIDGQGNDIIMHTLQDIRELPATLESLRDAWRRGDDRKLEKVVKSPFKKDFPELYRELVVDRNNAWVPRIETMLQTRDVELILVGVLHLVGDEGILAQLRSHGYRVTRF